MPSPVTSGVANAQVTYVKAEAVPTLNYNSKNQRVENTVTIQDTLSILYVSTTAINGYVMNNLQIN